MHIWSRLFRAIGIWKNRAKLPGKSSKKSRLKGTRNHAEEGSKLMERLRAFFTKKRRRVIMCWLASIVVFCVTYALVLPAITVDKNTAVDDPSISNETLGIDENQDNEYGYDPFEIEQEREAEMIDAGIPMTEDLHADVIYLQNDSSDIAVSAKADKETFPEETRMEVEAVGSDELLDIIGNVLDADRIRQVEAFKISFFDKDDEQIQPDGNIEVSLKSQLIRENKGAKVVAIRKNGEAVLIDDLSEDTDLSELSFEAEAEDIDTLAVVVTGNTLSAEGDSYQVEVSYDDDALLPEEASLSVDEITDEDLYESYKATIEEELGKEVTYLRLFDITILDENGDKIQPETSVRVSIELDEICSEDEDLMMVHIPDEGEYEVVETESSEQQVLSFEAEGFSIYAVVSTTIEKSVLASDGHNYLITVTYGQEAGVPENAQLEVEEILQSEEESDVATEYENYLEKTREALGADTSVFEYVRFFDIRIVDENGNKVQIQAPVDVKISLADKEENVDDTQVVHFADGADSGDLIENIEVEDDTLSFEAEGFSVYAIVEGPNEVTLGWNRIKTINELVAYTEGVYIGHVDGYFFRNTLDITSEGRTGIKKTSQGTVPPEATAALYYFEWASQAESKVYAYCLTLFRPIQLFNFLKP